jgi:hypothetical protein
MLCLGRRNVPAVVTESVFSFAMSFEEEPITYWA